MRNFAQLKQRILVVVAVLCALDVALIAYMVWPGSSSAERRARTQALQQQVDSLRREVAPLKGMDVKLVHTRGDVKDLYQDRIPHHMSQISGQIQKLSQDIGVSTQSIKYSIHKPEKGDLPDVDRLDIETSVTGDYAKVARFINGLEQSKMFFVIRQIGLSGTQEGGLVTLQIKFETYMKESA